MEGFLAEASVLAEAGAHRNLVRTYLLRPIYMEYLYVEFVCKCIYVYFTYILDGAGTVSA